MLKRAIRIIVPILVACGVSVGLVMAVMSGASAQQPLNCADPQFQNEMNQCALLDWEQADAELNAVWGAASAQYKQTLADTPPDFTDGRDHLLEAQRLWIKFRDLHCQSEAMPSAGGTIYPLLYHSCRANLTRTRTAQLHDIANFGG